MSRRLLLVLLCQCFVCWASFVDAHEFRPATLTLNEVEAGRFRVDWSAPVLPYDFEAQARPSFPAHCRYQPGLLDCGKRGLSGEIRFPMLEGTTQRVFLRVHWFDGEEQTFVLNGGETASLDRSAGQNSTLEVARGYLGLGIEHILFGVDHLLFVIGLVVLVRQRRRLVLTVTAFTLSHSVTLVLATLGLLTVPQAPVEAAIALSILLLAAECADPRPSLTRRYPWLVAFGFGLLHGFGFAGALSEAGLPADRIPLALLFFNVGVELGQLAVVLVAWGLMAVALGTHRAVERLGRPLIYAMGTAAAYWTLERIAVVLGVSLA